MFDIVMPLYNKEQFVAATIKSVLAQTFGDWRLIVVDDGSADGGAEVARSFDDSRITCIQQGNAGVGPARNAGIRAGSAEWIAFLDADDIWHPSHLDELDEVRRSFPEATLLGCGFRRFAAQVPKLDERTGDRRLSRYFAESARGRQPFTTSSAAVRRTAIDAVGLFEPLPGNEDVELWARLALYGPVAVSSRVTVGYRVDTGGITDCGMGGDNLAAKPMRREEMSSTIPTLTARLPKIRDSQLRRDISEYMDSRVGLSLVRAVRSLDLEYARHLLGLYEGAPRGRAKIAAAVALLPEPLARILVSAGLAAKRAISG